MWYLIDKLISVESTERKIAYEPMRTERMWYLHP
jgi:hypothetical protein